MPIFRFGSIADGRKNEADTAFSLIWTVLYSVFDSEESVRVSVWLSWWVYDACTGLTALSPVSIITRLLKNYHTAEICHSSSTCRVSTLTEHTEFWNKIWYQSWLVICSFAAYWTIPRANSQVRKKQRCVCLWNEIFDACSLLQTRWRSIWSSSWKV